MVTVQITRALALKLINLCDDAVMSCAEHSPDLLADEVENAIRDADMAEAIAAAEMAAVKAAVVSMKREAAEAVARMWR